MVNHNFKHCSCWGALRHVETQGVFIKEKLCWAKQKICKKWPLLFCLRLLFFFSTEKCISLRNAGLLVLGGCQSSGEPLGCLEGFFLWVCAEEHTIYSELRVERFLLGAFFCQSTQCTCKMGRWAKFVLNPHGT